MTRQVWINPKREKARVQGARNRAKKRGLPAAYTVTEWRRCLSWFDGRCAYCGRSFRRATMTLDHVIPLGLDESPGTVAANIVPACDSCNNGRNSTPLPEWLIGQFGAEQAAAIQARIAAYMEILQVEAVQCAAIG